MWWLKMDAGSGQELKVLISNEKVTRIAEQITVVLVCSCLMQCFNIRVEQAPNLSVWGHYIAMH